MIQFPETAQVEWEIVANAANEAVELRKRLGLATRIESKLDDIRIRYEAERQFQQELDADSTPTLEMVSLTDYRKNPTAMAPTDLIDGVLKDNGTCLMLGPAGSGKSTTGLQMVHSLATGDDWLGQKVTQVNGGFGIVSYDMDGGMMLDWLDGFPNVDADKIKVVNAYKRGNPLGVPEMRAQIVAAFKASNTEVVLIDSFSASFFGHDQNDAASVMAHYRDLKMFALTEVGARSLIIVVHSAPGSPHKARGSTVHHDVADSIVGVEVDSKTDQRTISMVKYRAARGQHQMNPVIVTAPDSVTHLVDLDLGAMTLASLHVPARAAFAPLPTAHEDPDVTTDSESEDDL